jgi:hypothetical protein
LPFRTVIRRSDRVLHRHRAAQRPSRVPRLIVTVLLASGVAAASPALAAPGPYEATLGPFHVRHENGSVSMMGDRATLSGTVYLWPIETRSLQLRLRNATVTGIVADASRQTSGAQAEELELKGRPTPIVWSAMQARGALEIVAGAVTAGVAGGTATISATADQGAIALSAAAMNVLGCVHQVGPGSQFTPTATTLVGTLQCSGTTIASSRLELSAGGVAGRGTIKTFNHVFDLLYRGTAGTLAMTGEWIGAPRGWRPVPGAAGAEYQTTVPRVLLTLTSTTSAARFQAASVQTRSTARRPDGEPVAAAALTDVEIDASPDGSLSLLLPGLAPPPLPPSTAPLCDATCPEIKDANVPPWVASGTSLGSLGSLGFADRRQGECYVYQRVIRLAVLQRGPLNGACRAATACPAGDEKFSDSGVWRCRPPIPYVPVLPVAIPLRLNELLD